MITKIKGKLLSVGDDQATLAIDSFEYQILIPEFARRQLQPQIGSEVDLHTIHYLEGNLTQGRVTPRLVGFTNKVEREFFELFCSVDGVGAKKALRAMVRPVRDVALMIESQDAKAISTLPGVGPATADRIIAKLRRKMPKFVLMVQRDDQLPAEIEPDLMEDTFQVLCSLGHTEHDARKLLDGVLATKKKYKDVESLLQAVYQSSNS